MQTDETSPQYRRGGEEKGEKVHEQVQHEKASLNAYHDDNNDWLERTSNSFNSLSSSSVTPSSHSSLFLPLDQPSPLACSRLVESQGVPTCRNHVAYSLFASLFSQHQPSCTSFVRQSSTLRTTNSFLL